MTTTDTRSRLEVWLTPEAWDETLRRDVLAGLCAPQKELPATLLYDERGCALFEEITRLPEYYPTRAERAALELGAAEIGASSQPATLVELGAGSADKTRALLDELTTRWGLARYVPFDVAADTTRETVAGIAAAYPSLQVFGVVGDFRRHLRSIPADGRRLVAFLGGTVGNLRPDERAVLYAELVSTMAPGDTLLLGTDLLKDRARLVRAYDDAAGVTAAFNKNVLDVLNRELRADFDQADFDHAVCFDEDARWIEMHLRARRSLTAHVADLDLAVRFEAGETIRTEISAKFELDQIDDELGAVGLRATGRWTDPAGDYALTLAVR